MKSVCFVVQNVYDYDKRVRRKAEALVAAGYSVDVLALRDSSGKKSYTLNGVNVRTILLGKKRGSFARYFFEYAMFFMWVFIRVHLQMVQRRYLAIDVNTLPDFLIFAPILAKWMGAKLILDMHEIAPEFYISKYRCAENSWTVRMVKYFEKISIAFADYVVTINEPIQGLLADRGLPHWKSTVIMNSADEAQFCVASNRSTAAEAGDKAKFVMMYHGTLTHIYGLDIAIEGFALAHKKMPGAEFWILGSGPEKNALEELAQVRGVSSKVRFFGQIPSAEIPTWLSNCDIGVLPIRRDAFLDFAFPNKLPEFIIMGKGVVVSRLKTIRHYFGEDALVYFEPNSAADLARQMIRIYRDPELRTRLAFKAREEYAPIRWSVMKERYLGLIEQMVKLKAESIEQSCPSESGCPSRREKARTAFSSWRRST
jgi:glycosyltransferase involved in cell wall biosynthesis